MDSKQSVNSTEKQRRAAARPALISHFCQKIKEQIFVPASLLNFRGVDFRVCRCFIIHRARHPFAHNAAYSSMAEAVCQSLPSKDLLSSIWKM